MSQDIFGGKSDTCELYQLAYGQSDFQQFHYVFLIDLKQNSGLNRDLNPGPLAPKARIIPLDHWAIHDFSAR